MTKTEKYSQILTNFVREFAEKFKNASDGLATLAIIDQENHHYQSVVHGFINDRHLFNVQFHFDIIEDKVWLQCNHTDWDFGDDLICRGIPKSDIILGFQPEYARFYSGYGVSEKVA